MAIRFVDNDGVTEDIGDLDVHFYEKQVTAGGPFGDNAFQLAKARALDKARVAQVKAIRKAQSEALSTGVGLGLEGLSTGVLIERSIDGAVGAPDDRVTL